MKVRTRIAPSPTGFFHVGNLRTALYDYAMAKKHGGEFVLRIEDTDRSRFVPEAVGFITKMFNSFDLSPDEGVGVGGPHAPYSQSERLDIYKEYSQKLIDDGKAYYCFLTAEQAEELKAHGPLRSPCRDWDEDKINEKLDAGESYVVRYKIPKSRDITGTDAVQGTITINSDEIEDWVMIKSDGFPVYNFAVVIDDALMEITHVFRGVEFISSYPKNILLYEDFGWELPVFAHLPVLMDPEGGKMSKRKGAVNVEDFLSEGYLPEAILNFLMLLGWSSPEEHEHGESERELYTVEEFTELFDLGDLNKSNPVFNREKLLWFNQQYIKNSSIEEITDLFKKWSLDYLEDKDLVDIIKSDEILGERLELVRERSKTLQEIVKGLKFFYIRPTEIDWEIKQLKKVNEAGVLSNIIEDLTSQIEALPDDCSTWTHEEWEQGVRDIGDRYDIKHGQVFMVLRVAIVGTPFSPPMFEALVLLGKDEVLARLNK